MENCKNYNTLTEYYKNKYNKKVAKIALNAERYRTEITELEEKIENLKQEIEQKKYKKDNKKQNKEKFEKELTEKEEEYIINAIMFYNEYKYLKKEK